MIGLVATSAHSAQVALLGRAKSPKNVTLDDI
jgi:hypothetical protein